MTEQKRALVVDDSKSARLVLGRMLEKHALIVDTVESATEALDFLTRNRPDVIFMDHMMPGMDGFEAVRAIKDNPATATIPVMMYTSKGGDLYVGQARALGAVGVLPKTVAPVELFESLRKLGLVEERRQEPRGKNETGQPDEDGTASERADDIVRHRETAPPVFLPADTPDQRPAESIDDRQLDQHLRSLLEEQRVEIRKDVLLSMENVSRQTASKLHREVEEKFEALESRGTQTATEKPSRLPLILMAMLLLLSLGWNYSIVTSKTFNTGGPGLADAADTESTQVRMDELESGRNEVLDLLQSSWNTTAWAMNQGLTYDFDEIALDGGRTDTVETLLSKLLEDGFSGQVVLQTHAGEFCLMGDQEEGFRLPAPDTPVSECEFIGNPVQAADTPAAHQSLSFANFLNSTSLLADGSISLEVVTLPRDEHLADYPDKATATARDWNRAALANNRVLVELQTR